MSNHKVTISYDQGWFHAKCTCRQQLPQHVRERWQAEDWELEHLTLIERVKVHAGIGKKPSLEDQRNWYLKMEEDPDATDYDRGLWKQLRMELDRRLNVDGRETVDEQLPIGDFDDTPRKSSRNLRSRSAEH